MPKNTISDIRASFDLVADIKDARLTFCLDAAARTLTGWVGQTNYDEVGNLAEMKFAEANLTAYHLLLNSGIRIRRYGLVKREADAGASVTNNVSHEYYDVKELMALRSQFYDAARESVEAFRTVNSSSKVGTMPISTIYTQ
jgi:hypothetical protein